MWSKRLLSLLLWIALLPVAGASPAVARSTSSLQPDATSAVATDYPFLCASDGTSQCAPFVPGDEYWVESFGQPGMTYIVRALTMDEQGNLYAGGGFVAAGGVGASRIARWDGSAWHPLGSGMNHWVYALAVDGQGNLYAGGDFTTAGGVDANHIARWDGNAWHPLGSGVEGAYPTVWALAFDGQGNLYVGGNFTSAGDQHARNIARWDGSAWHVLGSGVNYFVYTLAPDRQGNLYAGGKFTYAGSVMTPYVARWDGSAWHSLGSSMWGYRPYPYVNALAVGGQGNLYVGGSFENVGGKPSSNIALWIGEAVRYRSFTPFVSARYSTLAP